MLVSDFIMEMLQIARFGLLLVCIAKGSNSKDDIQIILVFIVGFVLTCPGPDQPNLKGIFHFDVFRRSPGSTERDYSGGSSWIDFSWATTYLRKILASTYQVCFFLC